MSDRLVDGPPDAFAKLAALNPTVASSPRSAPSAPAGASAPTGDLGFVLLRPAAVTGALVSEICQRFERRGLALQAMRMLKPGAELAKNHYQPYASPKELVPRVQSLAPGPALATLWRGPGALRALSVLAGDADPAAAAPGTIRGDLSAADADDPLIELAVDAADAERLRDLWFEASDLEATAPSLASAPPPRQGPARAAAAAKAAPAAAPAAPTAPPPPPADLGTFYITTAINYANGAPHMGHAYEAVATDVLARYHRAYGRDVYFLTGADEHGQKIADTAAGLGIKPIELVDKHVAHFQALDKALDVAYDGYVRTTSERHKRLARRLWTKCVEKGGVYLGNYVG